MIVKNKVILTGLCLGALFSCDSKESKKATEEAPEASLEIKEAMFATAELATPNANLPYGIKNIIASGPGCPSGSFAVDLSNEDRTMSILFDKFTAEADGENGEVSSETACDLEIEIVPPKNHAVGIFNQLLRGYGYLEEKSHANFISQFNFKGLPESINLHHEFFIHGPYDNNFEFHNKTPLLWAPCHIGPQKNITLIAKTKMIARAELGGYSYMAMDSQSAELGLTLDMDFVPCEVIPEPTPPTPTPPAPTNPDEIFCASDGYSYNSCRVNGSIQSIQLIKQYSNSACTWGDTFGFYADRIWVDRGCRATFKYVLKPSTPTPPPPPAINELRCESHGYQYNFCKVSQIASAKLITQHSSTACYEGGNWGVIPGKGLWVDQGCRATFHVTTGTLENPPVGYYKDVVCESHGHSFNSCAVAITARNVEILDQYSNSSCVKNQDFGILNSGAMWVNNGCRGRFRVYDF